MRKKKPLTALKKMRMRRYLSQTELAERVGAKQSTVSMMERNGIRQVRTAERYAAVLSCRPAELMDFSAPRVNNNINSEKQDAKLA